MNTAWMFVRPFFTSAHSLVAITAVGGVKLGFVLALISAAPVIASLKACFAAAFFIAALGWFIAPGFVTYNNFCGLPRLVTCLDYVFEISMGFIVGALGGAFGLKAVEWFGPVKVVMPELWHTLFAYAAVLGGVLFFVAWRILAMRHYKARLPIEPLGYPE